MTCSVGPPKSLARSRQTSERSASEANSPKVLPLGSISRLLTSHCPTHEKSRKNLSSHAAAASSLILPPIFLPSAAQPPPSIHPSVPFVLTTSKSNPPSTVVTFLTLFHHNSKRLQRFPAHILPSKFQPHAEWKERCRGKESLLQNWIACLASSAVSPLRKPCLARYQLCIYLWGTLANSLLRAVIEKGAELRPLVC